jgi:hypothetical protein
MQDADDVARDGFQQCFIVYLSVCDRLYLHFGEAWRPRTARPKNPRYLYQIRSRLAASSIIWNPQIVLPFSVLKKRREIDPILDFRDIYKPSLT